MRIRPGIASLALVSLALNRPLVAAAGGQTSTTLYVDRHFEVRDPDQPVKYVFLGDTRVARITGSLSAARRLQRLRLQPGWNLCSLAVANARFPSSPAVTSVHRWDAASGDPVPVGPAERLPAGTVLWIRAGAAAVLAVTGEHAEPSSPRVPPGGSYLGGPGLQAWPLSLPAGVTVWRFDAASRRWRVGLPADLAPFSDLPATLAPGEAIYVHTDAPVELSSPDPARRITYYHPDHLGSASAVTDAAGERVEETAYYPFGAGRHEHRAQWLESNYGFTRKERDPESRLHYFEARYLAGSLARFASADPKFIHVDSLPSEDRAAFLQQPQKLNPFAYVLNRPLNRIDPLGLDDARAGAQRNQKTERQPPQKPKPGPAAGLPDPAQSSSTEYVLMLGDAKGGAAYPLAIESFGNAGRTPPPGGGGRSARHPGEFVVTRRIDDSSPDLQRAAALGTSFEKATIIVRTRGPQSVERMRIELSGVFVTGLHYGGGDEVRESVTLSASDTKFVLPEPPVYGPMPAPVPAPYPNTPSK